MSEMTKTIDEGTCPKCMKRFDAENLCNYEIGTKYVNCPYCGIRLEIYTSVEYQVQEVEE